MAPTPSLTLPTATASSGSVSFTVGRVDGGLTVLLTDDLQILEVPSNMLPNLRSGEIIQLEFSRASDLQLSRLASLTQLQRQILITYGQDPDVERISACLSPLERTHTTITVGWPSWHSLCVPKNLANTLPSRPAASAAKETDSAALPSPQLSTKTPQAISIDCFCDGRRMATARVDELESSLRLSGLEAGQTYLIYLRFRTRAGTFTTNRLQASTASPSDLSCLRIYLDGEFSTAEHLQSALHELGTQVCSVFDADRTSHVVSNRTAEQLGPSGPDRGELLRICQERGIPVVTCEWIYACQQQRQLQPVNTFYILK